MLTEKVIMLGSLKKLLNQLLLQYEKSVYSKDETKRLHRPDFQ